MKTIFKKLSVVFLALVVFACETENTVIDDVFETVQKITMNRSRKKRDLSFQYQCHAGDVSIKFHGHAGDAPIKCQCHDGNVSI